MLELCNTTGMKVTQHRWCNYGVADEVSGRPSSSVTMVMSSRPLAAQGECCCGRPSDRHLARPPAQSLVPMREKLLNRLFEAVGIRP
eukprot:588974-Heterocapsa_arctica.AAC.1